jgi:hypothetical protein
MKASEHLTFVAKSSIVKTPSRALRVRIQVVVATLSCRARFAMFMPVEKAPHAQVLRGHDRRTCPFVVRRAGALARSWCA